VSEVDLNSPLNYGSDLGPGSRNTPIRPRPDVRTDRRLRQVNLGSVSEVSDAAGLWLTRSEIPWTVDPKGGFLVRGALNERSSWSVQDAGGASEDGPQLVIWGTDVVITASKAQFTRFLREFVLVADALSEDERVQVSQVDATLPFYRQCLDEIHVSFVRGGLGHAWIRGEPELTGEVKSR
jgi:hypothetical protein